MNTLLQQVTVIAILSFVGQGVFSQSLWTPLQQESVNFEEKQIFEPQKYRAYQATDAQLGASIEKALEGNASLELPLPDGSTGSFQIKHYAIAAPSFYEEFPEIHTFQIEQVNGSISGYGDFSQKGLHLVYHEAGETFYLDPANQPTDQRHYVLYNVEDYERPDGSPAFECQTQDERLDKVLPKDGQIPVPDFQDNGGKNHSFGGNIEASTSGVEGVPVRTYIIATSTTYEYSEYHGGTKQDVASAVATMLLRLNDVLMREFSVQFQLMENVDTLFLLDPDSDEFTNGNTGALISEHLPYITDRGVSRSQFDVGHVLCTNAGGLAQVGSVCSRSGKERGVSCGFNPIGDNWYIGLVGHEIGHQMGSSHSFNYCRGNNESLGFGFEPGSGSTIMSYGGICGSRNVQSNRDFYYNIGSVESIVAHMHNGNGDNCPDKEARDIEVPEVSILDSSDRTLPRNTPFELRASASIEADRELLYCWEQRDGGSTNCEPGEPEGNCPLFRSYPPTTDSVRVFPKIEDIINGISNRFEVLPDYQRSMTFSCVVRDWNPDGGVIAWDYIDLDVDTTAGPFLVQPIQGTYEAGQSLEVEWDVANTDQAPVNCKTVDLYLSTDGGFNFDHVLAKGVPNTGTYSVQLPNIPTQEAKIKVKASENVFFNLSRFTFSIEEPTSPGFLAEMSPITQRVCAPNPGLVTISTSSFLGFDEDIEIVEVRGLPAGVTFQSNDPFILPGTATEVQLEIPIEFSGFIDYEVVLAAPALDTVILGGRLRVVSTDFRSVVGDAPAQNAEDVGLSPVFEWEGSPNADSYILEIATSPSFSEESIVVSGNSTETNFQGDDLLPVNTLLYWRILPVNECGSPFASPVRVFHTQRLECNSYSSVDIPKNISTAGAAKISSGLNIQEDGSITTLSVTNIRGTHPFVGELTAQLKGPNGTSVVLFDRECFNNSDFRLSLSDDAPVEIQCPLNQNKTYLPEEPLSVYAGNSVQGDWTLEISDNVAGFGGRLEGWGLEVCGSISVSRPSLAVDTIYVAEGQEQFVRPQNLSVAKSGLAPEDFLYNIVDPPSNGDLLHGSTPLVPGHQFSQYAVNSYHLRYQHDENSGAQRDFFTFTVTDAEGGWIGIDTAYIVVDEILSSPRAMEEDVRVFPNPAQDQFQVVLPDALTEGEIQLHDARGSIVRQVPFTGQQQYAFRRDQLPAGVYFLRIYSEGQSIVKKVILQ